MKKNTVLVAICNQKGGVGKSTMTIMFAGYYHYLKGLNVAVIDCDYPQYSLVRMKERDMHTVGHSEYFKEQIKSQYERIQKKAYTIVGSKAENAHDAAEKLMKNGSYDLVIVDLPGTVNSSGVISTIINMDYVITPIIPDRIVMQSSLSFSIAVWEYAKASKEAPLKEFLFFWNRKDARASTEIFDTYNAIMQKLEFTVLDTIIPETNRYSKELSLATRNFFRCTLFPPPAKLLKGSGLAELAEELLTKFKK